MQRPRNYYEDNLKQLSENVNDHKDEEHHDLSGLYDRNLTLINITNFKFIINKNICNVSQVSLVTIIHSSSENKEARSIIR